MSASTGYQPTVIPSTPPAEPDTPPADLPGEQPPQQLEAPAPDTGPDKTADLQSVIPEPPGELVVAGVPCTVNRVRTRELMLLARVVTRGIGENMSMVDLEKFDEGGAEQLLGLLVVALPEAGDEVLDLLRVLIQPREPITENGVRKGFAAEMENPDVSLTLDALAIMVSQERETFPLLVGKFRMLFRAASVLWTRQAAQEQHNKEQLPVAAER